LLAAAGLASLALIGTTGTAAAHAHSVRAPSRATSALGTQRLGPQPSTLTSIRPATATLIGARGVAAVATPANAVSRRRAALRAAAAASVAAARRAVDIGRSIVAFAATLRGRPYVFGAAGPRAFDCSGLVAYVYRHILGITLPHQSGAQAHYGARVSRAAARAGDLVVFRNANGSVYHVAIYAGHGMIWEAPHPGASVRHVPLWSTNVEFRRLIKI
jgi:cell wall-associated NlpC family hydrolase